ncbi:MAG: phytanoyl-CoA dioxygenase family protein [Planctomycetota bacterium]
MTSTTTPRVLASDMPFVSSDTIAYGSTQEERDYLFDLQGFTIVKNCLTSNQLQEINGWVDENMRDDLQPGEWIGDVQVHTYGSKDGVNFQNIVEAGPVFWNLLTNPAYFEDVKRYICSEMHHIAVDELFLNVRRTGGFIPIHSGGTNTRFTSRFRNQAGRWAVGQINVLMALTDIGHGDGPTTVVPCSHKAMEDHPQLANAWDKDNPVSGATALGMVEVHLKAGEALMFTDGMSHGSMPRTSDGERRVMIYRYSPHLLAKRFGYLPSKRLMEAVGPEVTKMLVGIEPRVRPGRTIEAGEFDGLGYHT